MGAQHLAPLILRAQIGHHPMPQHAGGPQLGDLHEEIHADGEEKRQPPGEFVDVQPAGNTVFHIFLPIGDGKGQFLHLRRPGLLHVIAGNRDRVELRHLARRITEDVADDPHRRLRRIDIGIADHELLQNVVLNGAVQLRAGHPLLLARDNKERQNRDHRAVHRHGNGHFIQRNPVEQDLHILDAVDRHARLADIADDARVIAVIPPVRRQIEGHRQPFLPRRQIAAIERVRRLGGGKPRILADRPRPPRIHAGPHPAREGGKTGQAGVRRHIRRGVQRLDGNPLRRLPIEVFAAGFLGGGGLPFFQIAHHSPLKIGLRFAPKAAIASAKSWLAPRRRWLSRSSPSTASKS